MDNDFMKNNIDFNFISVLEGSSKVGYVPKPDGGKIESGVTIASGFDIGQYSIKQIMDAFYPSLANKLVCYAGITGYTAMDALQKKPLYITDDECKCINEFSHNNAVSYLLDDWKKATDIEFCDLPEQMQTVIASVAFQYGDLPTRCPNFWKQAVREDWNGMYKNLMNFGDDFETRHHKEASKLLEGMNK